MSFDIFLAKVNVAVDGWFRDQCRNEFGAYYTYIKPRQPGEPCGDVIIAQECPPGYTLGDPTRVSPAWERNYARRIITRWAAQWPIL